MERSVGSLQFGRRVNITNRRGFTARSIYDLLNRAITLADPGGGLIQFTYDPTGNLRTLRDPRGGITEYLYDTTDRAQTRIEPLGRRDEYELYDRAVNLKRFRDRKSQVTQFTYNDLHQLQRGDYHDGTYKVFQYDTANRLQCVRETPTCQLSYYYDALDRLSQEITADGVIEYGYDDAGRQTHLLVAGQPDLEYQDLVGDDASYDRLRDSDTGAPGAN